MMLISYLRASDTVRSFKGVTPVLSENVAKRLDIASSPRNQYSTLYVPKYLDNFKSLNRRLSAKVSCNNEA